MKIKPQPSLSKLLKQHYLLVTLFPLVLFSLSLIIFLFLTISRQVGTINHYYIKSLGNELDLFLDEAVSHLSYQNKIVNNEDFSGSVHQLLDFSSNHDHYFEMFILLDHQGLVQYVYPFNHNLLNSDMSQQKYFYEPYQNQDLYFSEVFFSPISGNSILSISQRNKIGVLVGFLDLKKINNMINELSFDEEEIMMVVDRTGKIISHLDQELVAQQWNININTEIRTLLKKNMGTTELMSYNDDLYIVTRLNYSSMKWDIIFFRPFFKVYKTAFALIAVIITSLILVLLLISKLAKRTGNLILLPVNKLIDRLKKIEQGDYNIEPFGGHYSEIDFINCSAMSMSQQIQKREKKLQNLIKEKDLLMREINHRVKNNLIMLHGLISLQQDSVESPEGVKCLEDAKNRIKSISLVHQMLYQNKNYGQINLKDFFLALLEELKDLTRVEERIVFQYNLNDVLIDLSQAVPCGLILNELITNSLKHGFPANSKGIICVSLSEDKNKIIFIIEDNGIGMNPFINTEKSETFGLRLVSLLLNQLSGSMENENSLEQGVKIRIEFPKNESK